HDPDTVLTGFMPPRGARPSIGSVVSRVRGPGNGMPTYVSLSGGGAASDRVGPGYLGTAHRAFNAREGVGLDNLRLHKEIGLDRLEDRKSLLQSFDTLRRDLDSRGELDGMDTFTAKAFEMISSAKARDAFDISKESAETKAKYGSGGT